MLSRHRIVSRGFGRIGSQHRKKYYLGEPGGYEHNKAGKASVMRSMCKSYVLNRSEGLLPGARLILAYCQQHIERVSNNSSKSSSRISTEENRLYRVRHEEMRDII